MGIPNFYQSHKKLVITAMIIAAIILVALIAFLSFFVYYYSILEEERNFDISNAKSGLIRDQVVMEGKFGFKEIIKIDNHVPLIEDYTTEESKHVWKIKYNDRIGTIDYSAVDFYQMQEDEYTLMSDVSEFNNKEFTSPEEYEYFLLDNKVNFVYIRMGGRGWGEEGKMYEDEYYDTFITACENLNVPYGFYFLDEAMSQEEIDEEVEFVKNFVDEHAGPNNVLPVAIDLEYQEGQGRMDPYWDYRSIFVDAIRATLLEEGFDSIVYANARRASRYLSNLNCDFWIAYYPDKHRFPIYTYSEVEQILIDDVLEELNKAANPQSEEEIRTEEEVTKLQESLAYDFHIGDKAIGWQFSECGAEENEIYEKVDLSKVTTEYFKQFVK